MAVEIPTPANLGPRNPDGQAVSQRTRQDGHGRKIRASACERDRPRNRGVPPKSPDDSSSQSTELNRSMCLARSGSWSQTSWRIPMERALARNPLR